MNRKGSLFTSVALLMSGMPLVQAEEIKSFSQEKLASLIREAGFKQVKYTNLTLGVVAMHSGWKV